MDYKGIGKVIGIGASVAVGLALVAAVRRRGSASPPAGGDDSAETLEGIGKQIADETLIVNGCAVRWVDDTGPGKFVAHTEHFLVPAIQRAEELGSTDAATITSFVASLLVPGCPWPPKSLERFDIAAGLAGELGITQVGFDALREIDDTANVYLTLYVAVMTVLAEGA